ncbi:hypothetical protein CL614_06595 [archaeon]|nr:hypothetical protein [archaeon]
MIKISDNLKDIVLTKIQKPKLKRVKKVRKCKIHPLDEVLDTYRELIKEKIIAKDYPRFTALVSQRIDTERWEYEKWLTNKVINR